MLTLISRKRLFRNLVIARYVILVSVIAALVSMPLGLPGTSNTARADCWTGLYCPNGTFNVAGLVGSVTVCRESGYWALVFYPASGVSQGDSTSTCGAGSVDLVTGGDCTLFFATNNYVLQVNNCPSGSFTVGFRFFGYIGTGPYKVHGHVSINPGDFSYDGQCISNYAPIPGC